MKNDVRKWRWGIWIVYGIGIIVAIFFKLEHDGSLILKLDVNTGISLLFFVLVFIVFRKAFSRLGDGNKLENELLEIAQTIEDEKKNGAASNDIMKNIMDGNIAFRDEALETTLEQYRVDVKDMLQASENTYLDIDSYINNSLIDQKMHIHFLNQISGSMTGLGILGTFLGLSVGLNSFTLSGNSNDITNQIQPLMEGIKVAFHTSIYGIVYSIGFNFVYRQLLANYHDAVSKFQAAFHKCVIPISDNGTESTLIKLLKRMEMLLKIQIDEAAKRSETDVERNKALNGNLENIHGTLSQTQRLVASMSDEISGSFTRIMNDVVVPEIHKMGLIVEEFAKSTQKDQVEELSRLVDAFIQDMNKALGNSLEELGVVIKDTNEWQKKSLDELQKVLDKVNDTTVDLVTIDSIVEKAIDSVSNYAAEVEKMQESTNRNLESLNVQCDLNNEIIQEQTKMLAGVNEKQSTMQNDLIDTMKQIRNASEDTKKFVEEALEQVRNSANVMTEAITSSTEEMLQKMERGTTESAAHFDRLSAEVSEKTAKYVEDAMDQVKSSTYSINETITSTTGAMVQKLEQETVDSIAHIENLSADVFEKTSEHVENAMEQVRNSTNAMTEAVAANTGELTQSLKQEASDAISLVSELSSDVLKSINQQIDGVNKLDNQVMSDISDAADRLGTAAEDLDDRMQERIKDTFITFDQQLTNITSHLAGVLQQMEKVAKSTKNSYDGISGEIEDNFIDLQKKLEQYLEFADKLHHDISTKWDMYRQASLEEK